MTDRYNQRLGMSLPAGAVSTQVLSFAIGLNANQNEGIFGSQVLNTKDVGTYVAFVSFMLVLLLGASSPSGVSVLGAGIASGINFTIPPSGLFVNDTLIYTFVGTATVNSNPDGTIAGGSINMVSAGQPSTVQVGSQFSQIVVPAAQ